MNNTKQKYCCISFSLSDYQGLASGIRFKTKHSSHCTILDGNIRDTYRLKERATGESELESKHTNTTLHWKNIEIAHTQFARIKLNVCVCVCGKWLFAGPKCIPRRQIKRIGIEEQSYKSTRKWNEKHSK